MSEMVERVARKLAAVKMGLIDDHEGIRLPPDLWSQMIPQARAAIAAMREPTEAMWKAAEKHMDSPSANLAWWRAMIDEAAK